MLQTFRYDYGIHHVWFHSDSLSYRCFHDPSCTYVKHLYDSTLSLSRKTDAANNSSFVVSYDVVMVFGVSVCR